MVTHFPLSPDLINGVFAPSCVRIINNVVMHQAGRVDHLRDHSNGALRRQQNPEHIRSALLTLTDASHEYTHGAQVLSHPSLLLWTLQARAIRITIIGRKAFPFPSK